MDNIKALNEKYAAMNAEMDAIREKMRNESKEYIESACANLFSNCPEVHQIHWVQYSPYFNDGEACEFRVNEIQYVLTHDLDEDGEWSDGFYDGSRVRDESDIENAEEKLKVARAFVADPEAWRKEKFGEARYADALAKYDPNGPRYNIPHEVRARPYPSDTETAERGLAEVKAEVAALKGRARLIKAHVDAVVSFIENIPEDVMESLFGNHVSIVVNRDGMEIDEYNHD